VRRLLWNLISQVPAERDFRRKKSLGLALQVRSWILWKFSAQKEQDMDAIELLVYALIGVIGTLGLAAVIGYKVADHLDKKHHTD
jgi:hypothetical protein